MSASAAILRDHGASRGIALALEELPAGINGTRFTVAHMEDLAWACAQHQTVIDLARSIVRGLPSHDREAEARAIFEWVQAHCRYTQDPASVELLQAPCITLMAEGQGDCDEMTTAIGALALALSLGLTFRAVALDPRRPDEPSHIYPLLGVASPDGVRWLAADATHPGGAELGWEPPSLQRWDWRVS